MRRAVMPGLAPCASLVFIVACGVESDSAELTALESTVAATADGYVVQDSPGQTRGGVDLLSDASPAARTFLKFQVADCSVASATLRLFVRNPSADGPAVYETATGWTESTLTWNAMPSRLGAVLDDVGAIASGTWVEYDVSAAVQGGAAVSF